MALLIVLLVSVQYELHLPVGIAIAIQMITGSIQSASTLTEAWPNENEMRIKTPKRIDVGRCFNPLPMNEQA